MAALRLDHGAGLDLDCRASERGPWLLSLDHSGVAAEIGTLPRFARAWPRACDLHARQPSGAARRARPRLQARHEFAGSSSRSLQGQNGHLPRTTEAERMVIQRIGQDVFRDALMDYWGGQCPLTGITEPALLRASHIVPWADCTDAQRLDVHNGLLLSALWDAAFDRGLISFADDGTVLSSHMLGEAASNALGLATALAHWTARRAPGNLRFTVPATILKLIW